MVSSLDCNVFSSGTFCLCFFFFFFQVDFHTVQSILFCLSCSLSCTKDRLLCIIPIISRVLSHVSNIDSPAFILLFLFISYSGNYPLYLSILLCMRSPLLLLKISSIFINVTIVMPFFFFLFLGSNHEFLVVPLPINV